MTYNEDTLAQKTLADYLEQELGWESVYAYQSETFGPEGTLGRASDHEVVLKRYLGEALVKLNPDLPDEAYKNALRIITDTTGFQSLLQVNHEKYNLIRDGVQVSYRDEDGSSKKIRLRVFDFDTPDNNHFLAVREMWVRGPVYRRRPDVIGFVNGLPLLFVELKRPDISIRKAYENNLADYKDTIPHLFDFNAFIMLANGIDAKIGSLSAKFEHFSDWKRLEEQSPGVVQMETLVKGTCTKSNFMDMFENFILFDDSGENLAKIVARNHQYLGVNRALKAVEDRKARDGKLGVFWHTQGSGKSYSMVYFAQKVRRKLGGDFTFLVLTDRTDLDSQIYKTFAGTGLADNDKDPCRAESGEQLKTFLSEHKKFVFSLIQKFNQEIEGGEEYSDRSNIIVMSDEAHRSQYGSLAMNMRDALPNASFIGFTGTPLFTDDEITQRVFGGYVSTYDFQRAIEDKATLPLYYDARGDKLGLSTEGLNEKIAAKVAEAEITDVDVSARLESELKREYHIVTAEPRLRQIASDFVQHYSTQWESGKAMFVAIDKVTAVRIQEYIKEEWDKLISVLEGDLKNAADEQDKVFRERQLAWMKETEIAVVISEEQGEVEKFRKWDIDIVPHRKLMKQGFVLADGKRIDVETAFKKDDHPFRVAIVCAMWLTGFDVPSLATLYLDKPLQAHTLMQAIARANRVKEGKNNGLIVDYCGILKNLRKALATFAGHTGEGPVEPGDSGKDPLHPEEDLLADLAEAIGMVRSILLDQDFELSDLIKADGFAKNKALVDAKEAANINDEGRKEFEITARAVFRKYKACLTFKDVQSYRAEHDAISFIYKSLQDDRDKADISKIMQELNAIVSESITINIEDQDNDKIFDISKIDFERLRKEFEKSPAKNTTVQSLKEAIDKRLAQMMAANPLRTDFQDHFDKIVKSYNQEKDKNLIEATFEALMHLVKELDEESKRGVAEGLNEEQLAIYDLLLKPELSKAETKEIKKVAAELLETLKTRLATVQDIFEKEATRDAFRQTIHDYLWSDKTGLPEEHYNDEDIEKKTDEVFSFFYSKATYSSYEATV